MVSPGRFQYARTPLTRGSRMGFGEILCYGKTTENEFFLTGFIISRAILKVRQQADDLQENPAIPKLKRKFQDSFLNVVLIRVCILQIKCGERHSSHSADQWTMAGGFPPSLHLGKQ